MYNVSFHHTQNTKRNNYHQISYYQKVAQLQRISKHGKGIEGQLYKSVRCELNMKGKNRQLVELK